MTQSQPGKSPSIHRPPVHLRLFAAWLFFLSLATNGVFAVLTFQAGGRWFLPLDDAFIHFQYAHMAGRFQPFQFFPGEPFSTGATSPLYPLLLAPLTWFLKTESLAGATFFLGLVWKTLAALGIFSTVRVLTRHRAPALLAAHLVCIGGAFTYGALNGMETGMFAAALAWSAALMARLLRAPGRPAFQSSIILSVVLAVATLSRPEAVLIPAAVIGTALFSWRVRERLLAAMVLSLIPIGGYFVLVYTMTGGVETSTASSKLISAHPYQPALIMAGRALAQADELLRMRLADEMGFPPLMLLFAVAALGVLLRRGALVIALLLLPLSVSLFSVNPLLNEGRYFHGFLPLLTGAWVLGAWMMTGWFPARHRGRVWLVLWLGGMLAVLPTLFGRARDFSQHAAEMRRMHREAARWIDETLPGDAILAIHDAGILGALSNRRVLDMNGLVTPEFHGISGSVPGGIIETLAKLPFDRLHTHVVSFPSWADETLRTTYLARFPFERNTWGNGEALTVWESALPDFVLPLEPLLYPWEFDRGYAVVDSINHGDLESERAHGYTNRLTNRWEMMPFAALRRLPAGQLSPFYITEGGRVLTDRESFRLACDPDKVTRLLIRIHASAPARLRVKAGKHSVELEVEAIPYEFQELYIPVPETAMTGNEVEVQVRMLRDGPDVPDGIEIFRAWLLQVDPAAAEPDAPFQRMLAERRALFEDGLLAWFDGRADNRLPIEQRYQVFWHVGFRHEKKDEKVVRRLDNVRMGMAFPVRETGESPRAVFHARIDERDHRIWGYRLTPTVNRREIESILIPVEEETSFEIAIPPAALRRGLNRMQWKIDWIPLSVYTGLPPQDPLYHPPISIHEVELLDMGWGHTGGH